MCFTEHNDYDYPPEDGKIVFKIENIGKIRAAPAVNTLVLITHDNSIAVQADRIIRLEDGRVVYDGDSHAPEAIVQPTLLPETPEKTAEQEVQA